MEGVAPGFEAASHILYFCKILKPGVMPARLRETLTMDATRLLDRYHGVMEKIARAAHEAGRDPASVQLVIASKTQPVEAIRVLLEAGHRHFGENRVQEAQAKWPGLRQEFAGIELHLFGPLQTNKVRDAIGLFDVIETVDRKNLALALAKEKGRIGQLPRLLAEINTGEEAQKAGVAPGDADAFLRFCAEDCGLEIEGLMCIPPAGEQASPHFALLAQIAARHGLKTLSMGMTADFPQAIQFGATHVRVGTAIFGERI